MTVIFKLLKAPSQHNRCVNSICPVVKCSAPIRWWTLLSFAILSHAPPPGRKSMAGPLVALRWQYGLLHKKRGLLEFFADSWSMVAASIFVRSLGNTWGLNALCRTLVPNREGEKEGTVCMLHYNERHSVAYTSHPRTVGRSGRPDCERHCIRAPYMS